MDFETRRKSLEAEGSHGQAPLAEFLDNERANLIMRLVELRAETQNEKEKSNAAEAKQAKYRERSAFFSSNN